MKAVGKSLMSGLEARDRNQENQEIHETEGCGVKMVRDSEEIRNPGS